LRKVKGLNVAVLGGTGYVGLTTAVCFASKNHLTFCVGRSEDKVKKISQGLPIIYEIGLEELLKNALAKDMLKPTTDLEGAVLDSDVTFICVGTPSKPDGSVDLSEIREVSKKTGRALAKKDDYCVVVVRSTVVPGTTEELVIPALERFSGKKVGVHFGVCMIPEFLREGQAIKDFLYPRNVGVVIGEYDQRSGDLLFELYRVFDAEIMRTTLRTAEMIKYARNSYLAKDVSFANEIANICQKCGADYLQVKKGMEMDARIGRGRFLDAGAGFGGSCFPKDVKAIVAKAVTIGVEPKLLKATLEVNELQPLRLVEMAKGAIGRLNGKDVAVLGLAFKPGTDDMREAVSIKIINALLEEGAKVHAYDPQASETAIAVFRDKINYAKSAEEALSTADACLIVTEWSEFKNASLYNRMRNKVIIDGRRVLDPASLAPGFVYNAIGFSGPVKT
jgi:UDPglucose 6-dehydrogenase